MINFIIGQLGSMPMALLTSGVTAPTTTGSLGQLESVILYGLKILQWVAIVYCAIKVTIIGFEAMREKDSAIAIENVRKKLLSVIIGIVIVICAITFQKVIKNIADGAKAKADTSTTSQFYKDDTTWQ